MIELPQQLRIASQRINGIEVGAKKLLVSPLDVTLQIFIDEALVIAKHEQEMLLIVVQKLNRLLCSTAFIHPVSREQNFRVSDLVRLNEPVILQLEAVANKQAPQLIDALMHIPNDNCLLFNGQDRVQVHIYIINSDLIIRISRFRLVKILGAHLMDFRVTLSCKRAKNLLAQAINMIRDRLL
ncbi:hypothetical protein D3C78_816470 [compost metagenome]